MTPDMTPKVPMEGKTLDDDELRQVSGGITFRDPIRGNADEDETVVPDSSESEESGSGRDTPPPVFTKPVYDPE